MSEDILGTTETFRVDFEGPIADVILKHHEDPPDSYDKQEHLWIHGRMEREVPQTPPVTAAYTYSLSVNQEEPHSGNLETYTNKFEGAIRRDENPKLYGELDEFYSKIK